MGDKCKVTVGDIEKIEVQGVMAMEYKKKSIYK